MRRNLIIIWVVKEVVFEAAGGLDAPIGFARIKALVENGAVQADLGRISLQI